MATARQILMRPDGRNRSCTFSSLRWSFCHFLSLRFSFFSRAAHVEICTGTALSINYYSMHIIGCRAGAWKTRKTFVSYKSCIFNSGRARPAPPPSRHLLNYLQNALFIVIAHCDLSMILSQKYANWFVNKKNYKHFNIIVFRVIYHWI